MAPRPKSSNVFGILALSVLALAAGVILMTNVDSNVRAASGGDEKSARGWRLGEAVTYENLTVFPVYASQQADTSAFATLDEALASGDAVVTEQGSYMRRTRDDGGGTASDGSAQVNQLVLINRGKRPLLLLAGEVVSGGKQDRIIGKDRIVPTGAEPLPLSVFCVEHGRWTGGSDKFQASGTIVHPSVREKAAVDQSQAQVWAAVRGAAPMASARSGAAAGGRTTGAPAAAPAISQSEVDSVIASNAPTMSYKQIYESPRVGRSVEELAGQLQKRFERATKDHDVVGVVVAFGGEVAWSDMFASSSSIRKLLAKTLAELCRRSSLAAGDPRNCIAR